jgi:hypothetical protein
MSDYLDFKMTTVCTLPGLGLTKEYLLKSYFAIFREKNEGISENLKYNFSFPTINLVH